MSARTSVIANQQIFAHLSYPFHLPLLCVSLKHQVAERGSVVIVSSHGTKDGNWCGWCGGQPEAGLGKLSRAGQGYKAIFLLFQFAMEPNYLHIWPRNTFMMIALPNMVITHGHTPFGHGMEFVGMNWMWWQVAGMWQGLGGPKMCQVSHSLRGCRAGPPKPALPHSAEWVLVPLLSAHTSEPTRAPQKPALHSWMF